ncbi:hypothetical protein D9M69_363950 [compost metagenome]
MAIFQPSPGAPRRLAASVTASSKNTSLNSEVPVSCSMGRTVMPGWCMGTSRNDSPLWPTLRGSVRAMTKHQSDSWASEVQTFCPLMRHCPFSGTARVFTFARSEPAPGSE